DDFYDPDGTDVVTETADVNFTLVGNTTSATLTGLGTDSLHDIEQVTLIAGASDNILDATAYDGPVTLDGGAGNDILIGGAGNDILIGGDGDDYLDGGAGSDGLSGGAGDDTLSGGTGFDTLSGGADNDFIHGGEDYDTLFEIGDVNFTLSGGPNSATLWG